jgi:hypothetical protein
MISFGIIYGLMSFLTPIVFPFIFILGIVSQKLSVSTKMYWVNAVLVLILVLLTYQSMISIGLNDDIIDFLFGISALLNYWFVLVFLFLAVYLIGFFELNDWFKLILGVVVSLTLGVQLSLVVFSSSGPLLESLLASGNGNIEDLSDVLIGKCIAICFALLIILIVSRKIAEKFKGKSWSENIPKLLGIYLFITQIISIVNYFNA